MNGEAASVVEGHGIQVVESLRKGRHLEFVVCPTHRHLRQLKRFVDAQQGICPQALAELRAGAKRSHWMWFIFPQIDGLGSSGTARLYAIKSRDEAQAYLAHPVLGARLRECCEALLQVDDHDATRILGYPDDLKLRSSMTLFAAVAGEDPLFEQVLVKFYGGRPDARTMKLLGE